MLNLRFFILVNALIFIAFGPAFYFAPEFLAGLLGIKLETTTALADFRAMYGGMTCGAGVVMAMALRKPAWVEPIVELILLTTAGLFLGRVISIVLSGAPGPIIYVFMALEAFALVWGMLAWKARVPASAGM